MNPYQVLGVSPKDSQETIKKAYRKAAKECHPDTHPGREAEERFRQIGEAYEILGDEQKRKTYDERAAGSQDRNKGGKKAAGSRTGNAKTGSRPISREDMQAEFERFFSVRGKGEASETKGKPKGNPMDVSGIFERYMGLKK